MSINVLRDERPKLELLRHFDKIHVDGELTGTLDIANSSQWLRKSHLFAQYYAHRFDGYHILSSQSRRCTELVDILRGYNDIASTTILSSLIERDYGVFQGLPKSQMVQILQQKFPDKAWAPGQNLTAWLDQELYDDEGNLLFESTQHLKKRIFEELFYQFSRLEKEHILFVGHTGTIRALLTSFLQTWALELDHYLSQRDWRAHIIYGALQMIENGQVVAINHIPRDLAQILGYDF